MRKLHGCLMILAFSALTLAGCGGGGGSPTPTPTPQVKRLRVTNQCSYTIWVQHTNDPSAINEVAKVDPGQFVDYDIPDAGRASDRWWPKKGCDASGQNCTMGQNSNPCPAAGAVGCAPAVDSKLEATWGCLLADQTQCAVNPSDVSQRLSDTFFNTSAVDGYTLPFSVTVADNTITDAAQPCGDLNCAMDLGKCPTSENLSVGQGGAVDNTYASEDLRVKLTGQSAVLGCYSPCKKLNWPNNTGYNGLGLDEQGAQTIMYCCPTPPITVDQCRAGPVVGTQYVAAVHQMCAGRVYGYAYDDLLGLQHCSAGTKIALTFGPNCP